MEWYNYAIFICLFSIGMAMNVLLAVWYNKYTIHIFGRRQTYQVINKILALSDIMTAFFIMFLLTLIFLRCNVVIVLILSVLNTMVYKGELLLFNILAIDRLLAIIQPIASWWNKKTVCKTFLILLMFFVMVEIAIKTTLVVMFHDDVVYFKIYTAHLNYSSAVVTIFASFNMSVYVVILIIFLKRSRNPNNINDSQRLKNIVKVSLISFEASMVYVLLLIPALVFLYNPHIQINPSIMALPFLNCLTNVMIFSLNNKFLRNKLIIRLNAVDTAQSVSSV